MGREGRSAMTSGERGEERPRNYKKKVKTREYKLRST